MAISRSAPRTEAVSLVEVLVVTGLSVLILGVALLLFHYTRRVSSQANRSFSLGQDLGSPIHWLRIDLRQTALQSLRMQTINGRPTVSMACATDNSERFMINSFGAPAWNGWIVYQLIPAEKGLGSLSRFRVPAQDGIPDPRPWEPGPALSAGRVITTQMVAPGYWMPRSVAGEAPLQPDSAHPTGGLRLSFVRKVAGVEELSDLNPNQGSDQRTPGWSTGSTGLVQLDLGLLETTPDGRVSMIKVPLRVRPRH